MLIKIFNYMQKNVNAQDEIVNELFKLVYYSYLYVFS